MRKHEKYVDDVYILRKGTTQTLGATGNAVKSSHGLDDESFL